MILVLGEDCTIYIGFRDFGHEYYDLTTHDFCRTTDLCPTIRLERPGTRYYARIELKMTFEQAATIKEAVNKIWENIEKGRGTTHG